MEGLGEQGTFVCQAVNMWGLHVRVAPRTELVKAQIVDQNDHKIRMQR
jgi:hypothetical protein